MSARIVDLANGVPIAGFTGVNGAGKTLLLVNSAIADMAKGREVYSTVAIKSEYGISHPILSLRQLLELHDCTLILDEVSSIFSARTTQSLPGEIITLLHSLRHRNITVRWSAPEWMRADTNLRGVTQGLVNVWPMAKVRDESPWPRPRFIMAGLMDTSIGKADATPTKVLRRRFVLPKRLPAWGAYDTMADTPLLGRRHEGGTCPDCGGSKERPKHSEKRHQELGIPWFEGDDEKAGLSATDRDMGNRGHVHFVDAQGEPITATRPETAPATSSGTDALPESGGVQGRDRDSKAGRSIPEGVRLERSEKRAAPAIEFQPRGY